MSGSRQITEKGTRQIVDTVPRWMRAGQIAAVVAEALVESARAGYGWDIRRLPLRLGPNNPRSLTAAILAPHPPAVERVRQLVEQPT